MLNRIALFGLLYLFQLIVQAQNPVFIKIETGLLWDAVEGKTYLSGPFLNIEPKLRISKKTILGLRIGTTINTQRILATNSDQFNINNEEGVNGVIAFGPAFDYYFNTTKFQPHIGIGLGYYLLSTSKKGVDIQYPLDPIKMEIDNQVGILVRAGFNLYNMAIGNTDFSRYILGVEFHYIPKANVELTQEARQVGTVSSSYFSITIGRTFGDFGSSSQ